MEFEPGIEAYIEVSWGAQEEVRRLEVSGTQGTITIDFSEHGSLTIGEDEVSLTDSTTPLKAELAKIWSL